MLSNTTLFFLVLVPAMLSMMLCWPPNIDGLARSNFAEQFFYWLAILHSIVGGCMLIYSVLGFAVDAMPPGMWFEVIATTAFYIYLGYRYAQLAAWVKGRRWRRKGTERSITGIRGIVK